MRDIEERLARLEARSEISALRARYCWHTTRGDRDAVAALFTEDCLFTNARQSEGPVVEVRGRAALHAYLSRMTPGRRVPMVMNEVTEIDGATAQGTCVMQSVSDDPFVGHYIDDFRRVDGHWLFAARRFFPYFPIFNPAPDRVEA